VPLNGGEHHDKGSIGAPTQGGDHDTREHAERWQKGAPHQEGQQKTLYKFLSARRGKGRQETETEAQGNARHRMKGEENSKHKPDTRATAEA